MFMFGRRMQKYVCVKRNIYVWLSIEGERVCVCTGCLNINGTHVTANNSTTNKDMLFSVSDLKIVYYNNYQSSITRPWTRKEKYFASLLIWRQNHSKLCKQNFAGILTQQLSPEKPHLSLGTQISSHLQDVICKMSGQCRCSERFCRKESEKVPLKMFQELGLSRAL